jgi:hypothetical protein
LTVNFEILSILVVALLQGPPLIRRSFLQRF